MSPPDGARGDAVRAVSAPLCAERNLETFCFVTLREGREGRRKGERERREGGRESPVTEAVKI